MDASYPVRDQLNHLLRCSKVWGDGHHDCERALLAPPDTCDGYIDAILHARNLQAIAVQILETLITSDIAGKSITRGF
jgi:hypothetical protein